MAVARWDKEKLYRLVKEKLGERLFVVVSNREPYIHIYQGNAVICQRPVGGLTTALDPVLRASRGIWVAHGSGDADKATVDEHDHVAVPPEEPSYTLRRVWLTGQQVQHFYLGFSNEALWPLCHVAFTAPTFRDADWEAYIEVNRIFADAVMREIGDRKAVVLIQDYHFALLSRMLKKLEPSLTIGQFWHIPWPCQELFRTCPWQEELLDGLLGNDLLGFHIRPFCDNFLDSIAKALPVKVDRRKSSIAFNGRQTSVEAFPISVDFDVLSEEAESEAVAAEMASLRRELNLGGKLVGLGTDRLDYTKGIPQRLQAFDRFLELYPSYRGKVVFIQAGITSRTEIESYRGIGHTIQELIDSINAKYGGQPVICITRQLSTVTLAALRRLAHFCVVSALHDGMNLVAKEYVASRTDGGGVLLLSKFTGAAPELTGAILINPFAITDFAHRIKEALEMPEAERRRRMSAMRRTVAGNNIYRWGAVMVSRLIELADNEIPLR